MNFLNTYLIFKTLSSILKGLLGHRIKMTLCQVTGKSKCSCQVGGKDVILMTNVHNVVEWIKTMGDCIDQAHSKPLMEFTHRIIQAACQRGLQHPSHGQVSKGWTSVKSHCISEVLSSYHCVEPLCHM